MRTLVHIGHPAHVHLFKNLIWELERKGHKIEITTMDKDVSIRLLDAYNFKYHIVGKNVKGLANKALNLVRLNFKLFTIAKRFNPDVLISICSPYVAQVSFLLRKPYIGFGDTEHSRLIYKLSLPFTNTILTPSCFKKDLGKKQVRYNGYHELAYLHPNYFKPNPAVLDEIGLSEDDKFIILRFVSWSASHDVGQRGIQNEIELVKELEKYGKVFITSEGKLEGDLEKYKIKVSPEKMHDLLYHATMYIGEGATMASEAAVLGTPAIYVNTLRLGYTDDEEERYGLVYNFSDPKTAQKQAFEKAIELLENENLKSDWQKKKEKLLRDKIDVTKWMIEFIENYPQSFYEYKSKQEDII